MCLNIFELRQLGSFIQSYFPSRLFFHCKMIQQLRHQITDLSLGNVQKYALNILIRNNPVHTHFELILKWLNKILFEFQL